jgi:putative ABC transport system permease protein
MRVLDIIARSGRNLRQAKVRTLLTASALAVGGFTLTLTMAASTGARAYADRLITSNFDPTTLLVAKDKAVFGFGNTSTKPQVYDSSSVSLTGDGNFRVKRLTKADIGRLQKIEGVERVNVQYTIAAQYITRQGVTNVKKYTASLADYSTAAKPELVSGKLPDSLKPGYILLPEDYVSILGFTSAADAINKPVIMQLSGLTGQSRSQQYIVAAVVQPPAANLNFDVVRILVSDKDAADIYAFNNAGTTAASQYLNAIVKVSNGTDEATLTAAKQRIEKAGFAAQTVKETQASLNQIIQVLQVIILVFGFITLIASFFGVVNTQYISVLERTREIGLMKALGMRRGTVSWLFIIEATWIGFIGALLGALLAVAVGSLLNPVISDKINFGQEHLLIFQPQQIILLIVFLMVVTTVAGLLPARKAARLDPIEALRTE